MLMTRVLKVKGYDPGCVEPYLCVCLSFPVLQVEDELNSPVVVFRFSQETSAGEWLTLLFLFQHIFLN